MDIKKIFAFAKNEFIYGGHLLSLGAASIAFTSAVLLDIKITWDFLLLSYLVVYFDYSYDRFAGFSSDITTNSSRTLHMQNHLGYIPAIIVSVVLIIALVLVRYGNIYSCVVICLMIIGGILYTGFFKNITKRVVGFKSLYVPLVWSSLVILLYLYYSFHFNTAVVLMFTFVFFRWVINVSFCDLKDVNVDKEKGLLTFAVVMGKNKLLRFLSYVNVVSILPILLGVYLGLFPKFATFLVFPIVYAHFYFGMAKKNFLKINYISDVLADSEFVLWVVFIILGKIILW